MIDTLQGMTPRSAVVLHWTCTGRRSPITLIEPTAKVVNRHGALTTC
jgi:hypothetical protein